MNCILSLKEVEDLLILMKSLHIFRLRSNPTPELEGLNHNYMMDDKGNLYIRVTIDNVLFERTNERIRLNVFLEDKDYQVTGKIEVFDPISRQRNSFSDEVKGK